MGRSYRELIAWQKAMKLVTEIYEATQRFPSEERYGLTNQLRRASVSVPSNIAEGQARFSQKEFHHFLSQARGSLVEIETQLLIARNLKYLPPVKADILLAAAEELGRVLNGLIASIKNRAAKAVLVLLRTENRELRTPPDSYQPPEPCQIRPQPHQIVHNRKFGLG